MDVKAFFKVGVLIIPVVSSLCCLLLLYMARLQKKIKFERGLVNPLMLYLAAVSFSWMAVMTYTIAPVLYVYINGLMYLCYLLIPVLFYHFVFNITKTSCSEKLNSVHYLIPLVLIGVFVGWSLFVPFDAQMYIVKNGGDYLEDYKLFSALFSSKLIVRLIFSIIYTSLSIARIYRYRKAAINYTANEETGSLRWLNMLLLLTFGIILLPLAAAVFTRRQLISSVLVIFPFLILLFQHVVLCYNMLTHNYILIVPTNGEDEVTE